MSSSRLLARLLLAAGGLCQLECGDSGDSDEPATAWSSLPVLPADHIACGPDQTSPSGFGFHGSCCKGVVCQAPAPETGQCPEPSKVRRGTGSGTCSCDTTEGPFQADEAHKNLTADGKGCCYLAGIITCDGRPLFIEGALRRAPVRGWAGWA